MDRALVMVTVLSGLCFLPPCVSRFYILVQTSKAWTDAQSYCRSVYTDLAVVQNKQQLAELNRLIGGSQYVWIGLQPDIESWRWSLENQDYYGAGQADFRNWQAIGPNGGLGYYRVCVEMLSTGEWQTAQCNTNNFHFMCYNGSAAAQDPSSGFILVNQLKTWMDAQTYCRLHHTDLASVRNQAENERVRLMLQYPYTWIGLYRDSWKWSDGSPVSFTDWNSGAPTATVTDTCVASNYGKWTNRGCSFKHHFACFAEPAVRKQLVHVELEKTDSSVDMEELKDILLQQLSHRLDEHILDDEVSLGWVERPDGDTFQKKNTDGQEEKK
ncbi:hypothetical protein Q5P01_017832 [Channa striata]|uniref:C-type lectin domain-containing protein n=1 Tax=Channa striata TaxID=64152 RepID=A0AA88MB02_CHASR|nr:hypothetical protein Q5P01_017832 [Channa striata]